MICKKTKWAEIFILIQTKKKRIPNKPKKLKIFPHSTCKQRNPRPVIDELLTNKKSAGVAVIEEEEDIDREDVWVVRLQR